MDKPLKTSSVELDFAFVEDYFSVLIRSDHPLKQQILDVIYLRMLSDDLMPDTDLFPTPQDYLDHAWVVCLGTLVHYFPEVEFVRNGDWRDRPLR